MEWKRPARQTGSGSPQSFSTRCTALRWSSNMSPASQAKPVISSTSMLHEQRRESQIIWITAVMDHAAGANCVDKLFGRHDGAGCLRTTLKHAKKVLLSVTCSSRASALFPLAPCRSSQRSVHQTNVYRVELLMIDFFPSTAICRVFPGWCGSSWEPSKSYVVAHQAENL